MGLKTVSIDLGDNADWTKLSWDLPAYKSEEWYQQFGYADEEHFKTTPVYRNAVQQGWIVDDEWSGAIGPYGAEPE